MFGFGDKKIITEKIRNTTVTVRTNFTDYPKRRYEFDMLMLKKVNSGDWKFSWNKDKKGFEIKKGVPDKYAERAADTRLAEVMKKPEIEYAIRHNVQIQVDYKDFKKTVSQFLARIVFYLVEKGGRQDMIEGKERMTFTFQAVDSFVEGYLAYQDEEKSVFDRAAVKISGAFLTGRIYGPWVYTKHIDEAYVERTLSHEYVHQVEWVKKQWDRPYAMKKQLKNFMRVETGWVGELSLLYEIAYLLHFEGHATFWEKQNTQYVVFDLNHIERLVEILLKISLEPSRRKAKALYEEQFSPTSTTGEYYLGFLMCYTIGLAIMKRNKGKNPKIQVVRPENRLIDFSELGVYIAAKREVYLEPLDPKSFKDAYAKISNLFTYQEFIKAYETACEELGFKKPVKFLSSDFYNMLFMNCHKSYREYSE